MEYRAYEYWVYEYEHVVSKLESNLLTSKKTINYCFLPAAVSRGRWPLLGAL